MQWRVAPAIAGHLGLEVPHSAMVAEDLWQQLGAVDAVVTTPSTAALEAMLCGKPVALLDYTNSPQYLGAAWCMTAQPHLDAILPALLVPTAERLLFQEQALHDALECRGPAGPRLALLMQSMIEAGQAVRAGHQPPVSGIAPGNPARAAPTDERALLGNELVYWREEARVQTTRAGEQESRARDLEERLNRQLRYGCGSLLARLVHTFPYPRRMVRACRYWRADRDEAAARSRKTQP